MSGVPFVIWLMFAVNAALLYVNVRWLNANARRSRECDSVEKDLVLQMESLKAARNLRRAELEDRLERRRRHRGPS